MILDGFNTAATMTTELRVAPGRTKSGGCVVAAQITACHNLAHDGRLQCRASQLSPL